MNTQLLKAVLEKELRSTRQLLDEAVLHRVLAEQSKMASQEISNWMSVLLTQLTNIVASQTFELSYTQTDQDFLSKSSGNQDVEMGL